MSAALETRIASALTGNLPASKLAALLVETDDALSATADRKRMTEALAVDPLKTGAEVETARKDAGEIAFAVLRLETAAIQLRARHDKARGDERAVEQAQAARDSEQKRLAALAQWDREYPVLANRIAGLLAQMESAGVPAAFLPPVHLPMRSERPVGSVAHYWPRGQRACDFPADHAPSCDGDLVIKAGA